MLHRTHTSILKGVVNCFENALGSAAEKSKVFIISTSFTSERFAIIPHTIHQVIRLAVGSTHPNFYTAKNLNNMPQTILGNILYSFAISLHSIVCLLRLFAFHELSKKLLLTRIHAVCTCFIF